MALTDELTAAVQASWEAADDVTECVDKLMRLGASRECAQWYVEQYWDTEALDHVVPYLPRVPELTPARRLNRQHGQGKVR